ncbi:hypothetical protein [Actinomadura verrucosospora]|uniref:Uncharacterized protein n=1 Tax=Actinomadura verrucosospora TaxID=46165 RepID=A0A7D3W256_ACTVE|nr:hypothetical protein [Actinomadura verrucosospora]QKG24552.1 hypothetical protein ACTIVE_6199 [Actinomadura verrucosospora]
MKRVIAAVTTAAALVSLPAPALADAPALRPVSLPFLWPTARLSDVTADGAGGVWIGGVQGRYCLRWGDLCPVYNDGNPVVRRRVGSSWKEYPINGWTGQGEIERIAAGGGETWIAGSGTYVARFDGSAFQKVAVPIDSVGMLSTGPAGTFISHWDLDPAKELFKRTGDSWTAVDVPGFANIHDLQALTATDAWAVGDRSDPQLGSVPAVAHFDGATWKSVPPPAGTGNEWFLRVVPVAADDVWAITQKHLAHWNGSAWTAIAPPAGVADLGDLTVDASGTPWVAPAPTAPPAKPPYRYSGGKWEMAPVPAGAVVTGLAAVPGGIWGVGTQGDDPAAFNN